MRYTSGLLFLLVSIFLFSHAVLAQDAPPDHGNPSLPPVYSVSSFPAQTSATHDGREVASVQQASCVGPNCSAPPCFKPTCRKNCYQPKPSCSAPEKVFVYSDQEQLSRPLSVGNPPNPSGLSAPDIGAFLAPPADGPIFSAGRSWGIRGLALHIPEMRIALPTLQLPSCFRIHHRERMRVNSSSAPYVSQPQSVPQTGVGMLGVGQPTCTQAVMNGFTTQSLGQLQLQTQIQDPPRNLSNQSSGDGTTLTQDAMAELENKFRECEKLRAELVAQKQKLMEQSQKLDALLQQLPNNCTPLGQRVTAPRPIR